MYDMAIIQIETRGDSLRISERIAGMDDVLSVTSMHIDGAPVVARTTRTTIVENAEEFAAIGHLRGWCHNSDDCPICKAGRRVPPVI